MEFAKAAVIAVACLLFLADDVSGDKCTVGCHGMQGGKAYQEGHTYVYDLEGTSVTSVPEAQNDATLKLKGTVELSVQPDCVQQIRLKGVQINGNPLQLPEIEKHALQFNYHNGHIDTEVCAEAGDTQASLNIKRAVASLFQTAVLQDSGFTTHHEVDIFGGCPTDFTFHKDGDSLIVQKERNLNRCSYRENLREGPVSAVYDLNSNIQSMPLLSSHQRIEQRFKRGVLNKAVSVETYKLKPFSNGENGAKTIVKTSLTLKDEKAESSKAAVSLPKSLIFEAPHPVVELATGKITKAWKEAAAEVKGGAQSHAAEKFQELIKALRHGDKASILQVYNAEKDKISQDPNTAKKIYLDALFRTASGEAAEAVLELMKKHELNDVQTIIFYASLALVDHVNLASVTGMTSLLDQPNLPRLGYLGVGQVIGKYCQQHSCENVPEIKQAIHKIREKIGNGKAKSREQETIIVSALKALGNAKYLDEPSMQKLASIAEDKNVRNRVRVAAIEALPARCSMKWKNILLKVLADHDEDSEIRIKAYLSLVACPCPHVASGLKETLDKETVNQVGSFIQSHLRNLRASADPNKAEAKRQLGLIKPRTKFPEDFRKFSFNNELSYHVGGLGAGSSVENNVIYSQNSFVPRSVNLNLTTEVFGKSFNFLELNTRFENLDRLIEHYFGPKGVLMEDEVEDLAEKGVENTLNIANYIKKKYNQKLRQKRQVKSGELEKFAKGVKLRSNEVDRNFDVDFSVKMFGIEMLYFTNDGNTEHFSMEKIIDDIFDNVDEGFKKLKKFDYNMQNHMQFLDTELRYPTGLGMTLSLGVTGTSVMHTKMHGKLDIPAIMENPKNADILLSFMPTVSVQVTGNMVVCGFDVESGMKVISTLHTDTVWEAALKILDGKGFDLHLNTPQKNQKLIGLTSEVLMSEPKGRAYEAAKFGKGKSYDDCFDQFSKILGVVVCGQLEFPYDGIESMQKRALFPLNGPYKFALLWENMEKAYRIKAYLDNKKPEFQSFEILLETPNSKINRRVSLTGEAGLEPYRYAKLAFDSPIKKISAEAVLKDVADEHTLTIMVNNDQQEYFARAGIKSNGAKYKPILEYKVPEHIEKLGGTKSGGQQYNVKGIVEVVDQDGGKKYVFDNVALVVNEQKLIGLDGYVESAEKSAALDMNLSYGEESVALKMNGKRYGKLHFELGLSALPSRDPNIGFDIKWEYNKRPYQVDNKVVFTHGPDLKSEVNRLTVEEHVDATRDLEVSSKVSYPALKLLFNVQGIFTTNAMKTDIDIAYDKFNFNMELASRRNMVKEGDCEVKFEAKLLENAVKLHHTHTIIDPHKCKFKSSLEISPGGKYEAETDVTYNRQTNKVDFELNSNMNLNGKKVKTVGALNANPANVNSHASFTVNDVKYVNFVFKLKKGANPHGNLALNLKNYLNVDGEMSMQNGKGNAHLNIDLPRIGRKIKGTGDLTVTGTQHVGNAELLLDAEKDPSKSIKFSTTTDLKKNSIDTKNLIDIMNHKFEINGKGSLEGTINEGELIVDTDVTLPNGRYFVYKIKRNSKKNDDNTYTIHVEGEIMDHLSKGGPYQQVTMVGEAKNVNFKTNTFDNNLHYKFVKFDGVKGTVDLALKRLPGHNGHKQLYEIDMKMTATDMQQPFDLQYKFSELDNGEISWKAASSMGKDRQFKATENYIPGNSIDKPCRAMGSLEIAFPCDKLRNIKFDYNGEMLEKNTGDKSEEGHLKGSSMLVYNDDNTIKFDIDATHSGSFDEDTPSELDYHITLKILDLPTYDVHEKYKYVPGEHEAKYYFNGVSKYGDKEFTTVLDPLTLSHDCSRIQVNGKITTPYEKLRNIDFAVNHEISEDGQTRKTDASANIDNAKYTIKSEIHESEVSPKIHMIMTCPHGKTEILSKFEKLGDDEYTGEWKVETPVGFAVADAHVNLESVDNFVITVNFDSDKLKHRKIHAEIANKPTAKTGRRIVITVTSDGKNIVTGSTSYKRREEAGKITVEGNGNLKVGEDTRSSSFKYTRQQLTQEKDGEVGVVIVLNAKFDPAAIVGDLKFSNKEILVSNSYCEQNKDCAHFKLQSSYDTDHKNFLKHQLTAEVDLKKFNIPVEFGLKTNTELTEETVDHSANLYLHSSKDKSEYTYRVYSQPTESGAVLTLPSRELAVISTLDLPKTKHTGAFKIDLSLYLDRKNRPNDKTGLVAVGDVNVEKNSLALSGEVKFIYPSQPKDMAVKGRLHYVDNQQLEANMDIDVFAKKTQKISMVAKVNRQDIKNGCNLTSVVEVTSRGQQLKVDLKSHLALSDYQIGFGSILSYNDQHQKPKRVGVLFAADSTEMYFLAMAPDRDLVRIDAKVTLQKNLQKINVLSMIADGRTEVMSFEAHDWNDFKYTEYMEDKPNDKLTVNGRLIPGQLAEIHADVYKDGVKNNLFHSQVHLDEEHFLKPDFGYNKDNILNALEYAKQRDLEILKHLKQASIEIINEVETELKHLADHLKKAQPNIKPLLDYYQAELTKMKNELHADQTIKDIYSTIHKHFGAIIVAVTETMKHIATQLNELQKQSQEIAFKLKDMYNAISPQLKESYNKIFDACLKILDTVVNISFEYLRLILNLINEHQKDLKEIAIMASELVQDIAKIIFKGADQIKKDINEFVELLINQMKALPVYEILKERYEEMKNMQIPENILLSIEELSRTIRLMMPTPELQNLFDATYQYIMKHVKHEKVDDSVEVKKIYGYMLQALQSIIQLLKSEANFDNLYDVLEAKLPIDLSMWAKLPVINSLRVSLFNLLGNKELPQLTDLYYTYRIPQDPLDIIPPFKKIGMIAEGGHFFTFDGKSFTMPGDCSYILAQDMLDGNFSVVANFNKGSLISLTVTEPKESITLKNNGNILVNNKPAEFPAGTKNLHARIKYTKTELAEIESDYGVHVVCGHKPLAICIVGVSGFYHGRLRGLLGDGNYEQYDDYTLPSGKITQSETEFANAYKVKSDCPAVNAIDQTVQQRNPVCTEYFVSQSSPLKRCFNYVNAAPYRDACDKSKSPYGPCMVATLYSIQCYNKRVSGVSMPPKCGECEVGGNKISVGDTFSVKTPTNMADILLVVELDTKNEKVYKDLVPSLVTELREELKSHGITDVHIGLIGYAEDIDWPEHYTIGGSTNIDGDVKMKFADSEPIISLQEAKTTRDLEKKITFLGQRLNLEFGTFSLADAYLEAIKYPYRTGALKAVVGVHANPCEKSPLPISLQHLRMAHGLYTYRNLGLTYFSVYQPGDIQVSGKAQKNIVGYDKNTAYVFADSKKKPLSGNDELNHNMELPEDVCAEFAVASGGAAFISSNLLDAKANQKRQFVQVTARRIADGITSVEYEEDCVCEGVYALRGWSKCKIVGRREKEHLAKNVKG